MINGPGKQGLNNAALEVTIVAQVRRQEGTP